MAAEEEEKMDMLLLDVPLQSCFELLELDMYTAVGAAILMLGGGGGGVIAAASPANWTAATKPTPL
ncbi:hypothetical protein ACJX0J_019409, partial [Zea mays]